MTTTNEVTDWYAGSIAHRDLDDGRVIVLYEMIFNVRVCVGPQNVGWYDRGFCYDKTKRMDALIALATWDGNGTPPGEWKKEVGT